MKILLVRLRTYTTNPYRHRVRTISPFYTTFRTGGSTIEVQTFEVLPWLTQTNITRTGGRQIQFRRTDKTIYHICAVPRATLFLIHESKLQADLRDIRSMPIDQLYILFELRGPVLKMTIRQLLCHRRNGYQQRYYIEKFSHYNTNLAQSYEIICIYANILVLLCSKSL